MVMFPVSKSGLERFSIFALAYTEIRRIFAIARLRRLPILAAFDTLVRTASSRGKSLPVYALPIGRNTMLIAERTSRAPTRRIVSFSLSEAARIQRDILASKRLECPRCGGALHAVGNRGEDELVWITTCGDCRLSVMVHCKADKPA
jgi:hypothetical protein